MIRHVASIAEIVEDLSAAVSFGGVLHFGLWERAHAARSTGVRPEHIPLGFTLGFEVDSVDGAAAALGTRGVALLQPPHDEPWGQRTARFLSPSGMLCEVAESPWARTLAEAATS